MGIINRILGLKAKKKDLENKKANLENQGKNTDEVKLDITINNILMYSAKTKPNEND